MLLLAHHLVLRDACFAGIVLAVVLQEGVHSEGTFSNSSLAISVFLILIFPLHRFVFSNCCNLQPSIDSIWLK